MMRPRQLILASGSRYRKELLTRLGLAFDCALPAVDETALPGESAAAMASRLAIAKARAIDAPNALVIGSDQAPALGETILRKPGSRSSAVEQLLACRGRTVEFHTAICLLDTASGQIRTHADKTEVTFLDLPAAAIERYVEIEVPVDSAGGFKVEGLGITLFERIRSSDPTALIGLPLIALARLLREAGLDPLAPPD